MFCYVSYWTWLSSNLPGGAEWRCGILQGHTRHLQICELPWQPGIKFFSFNLYLLLCYDVQYMPTAFAIHHWNYKEYCSWVSSPLSLFGRYAFRMGLISFPPLSNPGKVGGWPQHAAGRHAHHPSVLLPTARGTKHAPFYIWTQWFIFIYF
jgi:hypothetical protein